MKHVVLTLLIASVCIVDVGLAVADLNVVATDIGPFSCVGARGDIEGGRGITGYYFGDDPQNGRGAADYEDTNRSIRVEVRVFRDVRSVYLDRVIEGEFRDDVTGHLQSSSSLVSVLGNTVFLYCDEPAPDCTHRIYEWRSGSSIVVNIDAIALNTLHPTPSERLENVPCPEPTEILQAYLQHYPSSLTMYTDSDTRAQEWQRQMAALNLASAQYQLAEMARLPADKVSGTRLAGVESSLTKFAVLRERAASGPSAAKEQERIAKWGDVSDPAREMAFLKAIAVEYVAWWASHGYGTIDIPALPPITPAPVPTGSPG